MKYYFWLIKDNNFGENEIEFFSIIVERKVSVNIVRSILEIYGKIFKSYIF